ncbi:META domain-containing protein [uncultured Alistipes sp.]|uniref:META domain-containing protein n=1 Tax=uncultured Alistipes sp. TaxID=538949 RepID=UPI00261B9ED1|nr:META domain-containing protein [uncultured Alistipes sp.]
MRGLIKAMLMIVVAIGTMACCHCKKAQRSDNKPLIGTEWQLVQMDGRGVSVEADLFTVVFGQENRLSGLGACNRLTGDYEATETGALKIGELASTRMACPGMDRERAFFKMLTEATHYEIDGPMLMILTNGELKAVFQAR